MKNWTKRARRLKRQTKQASHMNLSAKADNARPLIALQLAHRAHWGSRSYEGLSQDGFKSNAIAYRCVRFISEAAASVGFCIARGNGEVLTNDPLQRAFRQTHSEQSFTDVLESFYGHLQVCGNGYLEAVKLDEQVIGFRALRPDRVEAVTSSKGYKTGYNYSLNNRKRFIENDIATGCCGLYHLRLFHPHDDLYGYAPMEAAGRAIDIHNEGARWVKALLDNSARPSGAQTYLRPIAMDETRPGDVLMFRMQPQALCKHVAILISPTTMLHAYWGRAVVESSLIPYWRRRWVHSFAFPEMDI